MPSPAATATFLAATPTAPTTAPLAYLLAVLIFAALAWMTGYLLWCAAAPFSRCQRCAGYGKRPPRIGRKPRHCKHCDGTGLRLRIGRRAWNHGRRLYRDLNKGSTR